MTNSPMINAQMTSVQIYRLYVSQRAISKHAQICTATHTWYSVGFFTQSTMKGHIRVFITFHFYICWYLGGRGGGDEVEWTGKAQIRWIEVLSAGDSYKAIFWLSRAQTKKALIAMDSEQGRSQFLCARCPPTPAHRHSHTHTLVHTHRHTYILTHTGTHIHSHAHTLPCTHTHTPTSALTHTHTYFPHAHAHTPTPSHTNTHTPSNIHKHTQVKLKGVKSIIRKGDKWWISLLRFIVTIYRVLTQTI